MTDHDARLARARALVEDWIREPTFVQPGEPFMVRGGFPEEKFGRLGVIVAAFARKEVAFALEATAEMLVEDAQAMCAGMPGFDTRTIHTTAALNNIGKWLRRRAQQERKP